MTEKTDEESVLGSLPATRPTRFGGERRKPANGSAAKATPRAGAKPRAAAKAKPKPTASAKPRVEPASRGAAEPATPHRPRPVRAGAPSLTASTRRARTAEPAPKSSSSPPSGTELVTTAIQAAGELAQIGLAVGGQVLKRAVGKLPKP
jgi:hypothetical protein